MGKGGKVVGAVVAAAAVAGAAVAAYKNKDKIQELAGTAMDKVKDRLPMNSDEEDIFEDDAVEELDTNGDGNIDTVAVDTDGDGRADELILDTTGDGKADTAFVDTTGDGIVDTTVDL